MSEREPRRESSVAASSSSHEANAGGTFVLTLAGSLVRFASAVVFNIVFGAAGFGRIVLARTWAESVAAFADFGGRGVLIRRIPALDVANDADAARSLIRRYRMATAVRGAVLGALVYLALSIVEDVDSVLIVGFILVPVLSAIGIEKAILGARGELRMATFLADLFQPIVLLVLVLALPVVGATNPMAGLSMLLLSSFLGFAALYIVAKRSQSAVELTKGADSSASETGASTAGSSLSAAMFVTQSALVVTGASTVVTVGYVEGDAAAAVMSMALRVISLVQNLNRAVESSAAPRLSHLHEVGDEEGIQTLIDESISLALVPTIILSILAIVGSPALLWFMGSEFLEAWPALCVLVIGSVASAATGPSGAVLLMTGKEAVFAWLQTVATVVQVLATVVMTLKWGILGAALASSITLVMMNVALGVAAKRVRGLSVRPGRRHLREGMVITLGYCSRLQLSGLSRRRG